MQKRSPISGLMTAAVFIILEAAAVACLHYCNELQRTWLSKASHSVMAVLWGGGEKVRGYFSLAGKNDSLAMENARLAERVRRLEGRISDAGREPWSSPQGTGEMFVFTPAEIVKLSNNRQHNYLIIDKGAEDGIAEGAGIMTEKGVVGIVEHVSEHYSYALSFRNYKISVSARLGKEGPVGPMAWDGFRDAVLEEIPHHLVHGLGDTVYTSGFSAIFPKDIPLGVTVGSKLKDGATYNLDVRLLEDFSCLKYVTVVSNPDAEEIRKLEEEDM